jgi:hypothetical protein
MTKVYLGWQSESQDGASENNRGAKDIRVALTDDESEVGGVSIFEWDGENTGRCQSCH